MFIFPDAGEVGVEDGDGGEAGGFQREVGGGGLTLHGEGADGEGEARLGLGAGDFLDAADGPAGALEDGWQGQCFSCAA